MASKSVLIFMSLSIAICWAGTSELQRGCGFSNPNGIGQNALSSAANERTHALFGEFPWTVGLLSQRDYYNMKQKRYICGASILAPNVVLTTAHCVRKFKEEDLLVVAGKLNLNVVDEPLPSQERQVKEIISHENYTLLPEHDIALLILESPFTWQENIRPICLPKTNDVFNSSKCIVSSWGRDDLLGDFQHELKRLELFLTPIGDLETYLREMYYAKGLHLSESYVIADSVNHRNTCAGDSGAALVCADKTQPERYYQVGISAWGIACDKPTAFISVVYEHQWLTEKLTERGIDFASFTA